MIISRNLGAEITLAAQRDATLKDRCGSLRRLQRIAPEISMEIAEEYKRQYEKWVLAYATRNTVSSKNEGKSR